MKHKARNRLIIALILFVSVSAGISIILHFLSDNIVFFITPSEISEKHLGQKIRIGGLVTKGSIEKYNSPSSLGLTRGSTIIFTISDEKKSMKVKYSGILPGLFRESQGVVVEGILSDISGIFDAKSLLTKHDENYRPPNKAGGK